MHILLSGYPTFTGKFDNEIIEKIRAGRFSLKAVEWKYISEDAKHLIKGMIRVDPAQ